MAEKRGRKRGEEEEERRRGKTFPPPPSSVLANLRAEEEKEEEEDGKRRPDRWFFRGWRSRGCKAKKVGRAKKERKESEHLPSVS